MITRHHLALVLMCTLILGMALFPSEPVTLGVLVAGSCIGAILPDIQMTKPKKICVRTIIWCITRISSVLFVPILQVLSRIVNGVSFSPADKRLTHSVPGILIIGAIITGLSTIPVLILIPSPVPFLLIAFPAGVMIGLVLHLFEDACTRKGIAPFFPFSTIRIAGSIRPCDRADSRIAQYHFHHCSMAFVIFALHFSGAWPESMSVALSLFALCSCLAMIVWFSDVRIETCCLPSENSIPAHSIPKNFTKRKFVPARKDRQT